jgi:hypothetical protein
MAVMVTVGMDDELVGVGWITPLLEAGGVAQLARSASDIKHRQKKTANRRRVGLEQLSLVTIA